MPIYPLIKTFWKPLLLLVLVIVSVLAISWYGARQYNAGVTSATTVFQDRLNKLNIEQQQQMADASARYQAQKLIRDQDREVQYVEVERIVQQPVYLTECIDDDGLRQINRAAASQ